MTETKNTNYKFWLGFIIGLTLFSGLYLMSNVNSVSFAQGVCSSTNNNVFSESYPYLVDFYRVGNVYNITCEQIGHNEKHFIVIRV